MATATPSWGVINPGKNPDTLTGRRGLFIGARDRGRMAKASKRDGVPKAARDEADRQVAKIVQYLLEKQERDALPDSFHDRAGVAAELDSIFSELERACQRLNALHSHLVMGELEPFYRIQNRVTACREAAFRARAEAFCAQQEFGIEHPQRTRGMDLQRSAVRLAVAYFEQSGRGQVRARSKEIMQKAGLSEPDESTVTKWIKEFRAPAPSVPIRLNVK